MVMEEGLGEGGIVTRRQRRVVIDEPVTAGFLVDTGNMVDANTIAKELTSSAVLRRILKPQPTLSTNSSRQK